MAKYSVYSVTSDKDALPSDGSLSANLSAIVHDDAGALAPASVTVFWGVTAGGILGSASTDTDATGKAVNRMTGNSDGILTVTATTADDPAGQHTNIMSGSALPAPTVSGASPDDQFTLDYYDLQLGVQMVIPHYPNTRTGDTVTFYWGDYSHFTTLSDPSTQLPMVINISSDVPPEFLQDGTYSIYYTATDVAGNISCSSALTVTVFNGGETTATLPKPDIPAAADGYINIADATNGVEVDVSYPSMVAGDVISLYWDAQDTRGNQIMSASGSFSYTVIAGETRHAFIIDSLMFFPYAGQGYEGRATAYYTVLSQGETLLALSFDTNATVDTIPPGVSA
ncbi:Ig-like domain-containing protein [Rahnella bonaserana]